MKKYYAIAIICMLAMQAKSQGDHGLSGTNMSDALQAAIEKYEKDPTKENKKKMKFIAGLAAEGGPSFSFITGQSESYSGALPGFFFGIRTSITRPDRRFSGDVGVNFTAAGGSYEDHQYEPGGGSSSSTSKLRLNYLNFPLVVLYRNSITRGFFAEAGIQPGFLLSAKDKRGSSTNDAKEAFNKFDMGVILGAGYQFTQKIGAGVRVVPGVTNINKQDNYTLKDRNLGISLRASYRLL